MKKSVSADVVISKIHFIRGQKVMLDKDLADLYQVPTKRLNEQVRRNMKRFPPDFMFQLNREEATASRSQFATLKKGHNVKYLPYAFTENGVAMLSSILNSNRAIAVNILIMRTFTRLRELLVAHKDIALKIENLERESRDHGRKIQAILQAIKELLSPSPEKPKLPIGFR